MLETVRASAVLVGAALAIGAMTFACSHSNGGVASGGDGGGEDSSTPVSENDSSVAPSPDAGGNMPEAGSSDAQAASDGTAPLATCITPTTPQACTPPEMTALPICKLSQTGCMDPTNLTQFNKSAVYYEVNSPLWSDGASKTRAFVLPAGGKIHVKDCEADAGDASLSECVAPNGIPNGPADTGKWVFPVGTVMIKNFMINGKLVETRLFMHVDAATANVIQNTSQWVGYNYAWNDDQTEATIVNNERLAVSLAGDAGTDAGDGGEPQWNYPSWLDCITCHAPGVDTLGPETDQMNREVDGGNQIDRFVAMGLFDDTAPQKPYTTAMVEPYTNPALGLTGTPGATTEQEARSYLAANCGFCHRPDVNNFGFDLRYSLSFADTGLCNQPQQTGIPGYEDGGADNDVDFAPGDHAASAMWIRMSLPVPASDPNETDNVGRMPELASFVVDTQATAIIASWIDSVKSCPDAGP